MAGFQHDLNYLVVVEHALAVAQDGKLRRSERAVRSDGVALDARHLDEPVHGVACEAQEMLKITRKSLLYPRIKRDTVIIYCLHNHVSLVDTESILADLNLPVLGGRDQ